MELTLTPDFKADEMPFEGLCVLVAEDNDLNWEIISQLLDFYKISSKRAVDGMDCIDLLNASPENSFDAIFMDVQMPKLNGKQAALEIRKSEREDIRSIPIIAVTANDSADETASCEEYGMNGYVVKPIDGERLKTELKRVVYKDKKHIEPQNSPASTASEQMFDDILFDYDKIYGIFGSDETVINLLQVFLSSHGKDAEKLKEYFDSGDYQQARPVLHSLVGASGNFCLYRLFNISKKLHAQVHAGKVECFEQFLNVWKQTVCEINDMCKYLTDKIARSLDE